jgi:hypothetical protein
MGLAHRAFDRIPGMKGGSCDFLEKSMRKELATVFLAVLFGFTGMTSAQVFDIPMSPEQETGDVESDATGHCLGYLDEDSFEVICRHDVENVTAAHIHRAAAGEDGPVIFPFDSAEAPFRGVFELSADDLADLHAGNLYVNVHSDAFPDGEIRGQIGPRADSAVFFPLEAEQETGNVSSDNTGHCMAVLNPLRSGFTIACSHTVEGVTGAHIHQAPAGEDGPIVFGFEEGLTIFEQATPGDERFDDSYRFEDLLRDLRRGDLYVNVHSPAFPGGELRGQIPRPALVQYFPQFGNGVADGPSLTSSVVLTNASPSAAAEGTVYFFDQDGQPLTVGLVEGDPVSEMEFSIEPLGSVTFTTDGLGDLSIGSAEVTSTEPVGGIIRFQIPEIGIAGFGSAVPVQRAITPARRNSEINTAIAIRNDETSPITITLEMRGEDGVSLGDDAMVQREIPANGRIAEFIDELFEDLDTTDVVGTVVISTEAGSFSAISLELGSDPGVFTSLPVTPVEEPQ